MVTWGNIRAADRINHAGINILKFDLTVIGFLKKGNRKNGCIFFVFGLINSGF